MRTKQNTKKSNTSRFKYLKPTIITLGLLIVIFAVANTMTGFGYTVARLRCGHQPIVAIKSFGNSKKYFTPNSNLYDFYAHEGFSNYFCTEKEAIDSGFTN